MKALTIISVLLVATLVLLSVNNCASSTRMQQQPPIEIGQPYFQKWVAGVEGGGAGVNLFIPVDSDFDKGIKIDSVYFRNMVAKLEMNKNVEIVFVGHLKSDQNRRNDFVLSSDLEKEANNPMPSLSTKMPFEVKDSECIVSYQIEGETKYFVLKDLKEKAATRYPRAKEN